MSEAPKHTPSTLPLKPGVPPDHYIWPVLTRDFPPQAVAPHSAAAYFTNPDSRLRPREPYPGPRPYFTKEAPELKITPYNFPDLYADLHTMMRQANLDGYRFHIRPKVDGIAGHSHAKKIIILGADQMNVQNYESFLFEVGHELGHEWRFTYDHAKPVPIRAGGFPTIRDYALHREETAKRDEVEADMISVCLLGKIQPMMHAWEVIGYRVESGNHPSTARRVEAVKAMHPSDCPVPGMLPPIPRYLQKPLHK
ncbi:MAG: hypothetical protein ACKVOE_04815 [Rickettsiales bacterium]